MALRGTDLAILSARTGVARTGASRFGFCPEDVEGTGKSEPGEYIWKETKPPTTLWTLVSDVSLCGKRPIASFTDVPDPSIVLGDVQFTDTSTPTEVVTYWYWDFGDGSTSYDQNPIHAYSAAGVYDVVLWISGPRGSAYATGTHTVLALVAATATADAPAPAVDVIAESTLAVEWYADPESRNASYDMPVTFTPEVVPGVPPYTYDWDWGDSHPNSTDEIPTHTFDDNSEGGTYTVTLTVTDSTLAQAVRAHPYVVNGE